MNNLVNTFTSVGSTITQTRTTSHRAERIVRAVSFDSATRHQPGVFNKKDVYTARRMTYRLQGRELVCNQEETCHICMHGAPFMQGGMRLVHRFKDHAIPTAMVAKFSKYEEDDNSW